MVVKSTSTRKRKSPAKVSTSAAKPKPKRKPAKAKRAPAKKKPTKSRVVYMDSQTGEIVPKSMAPASQGMSYGQGFGSMSLPMSQGGRPSRSSRRSRRGRKSAFSLGLGLESLVPFPTSEGFIGPQAPEGPQQPEGFIGPQLPDGYMTNPGEGFIGPQQPEGFIGPQLPDGYMTNPGEGFIGPQLSSGYMTNPGEGFIGPQLPSGYMTNPGEGFIGPQLPPAQAQLKDSITKNEQKAVLTPNEVQEIKKQPEVLVDPKLRQLAENTQDLLSISTRILRNEQIPKEELSTVLDILQKVNGLDEAKKQAFKNIPVYLRDVVAASCINQLIGGTRESITSCIQKNINTGEIPQNEMASIVSLLKLYTSMPQLETVEGTYYTERKKKRDLEDSMDYYEEVMKNMPQFKGVNIDITTDKGVANVNQHLLSVGKTPIEKTTSVFRTLANAAKWVGLVSSDDSPPAPVAPVAPVAPPVDDDNELITKRPIRF